MNYFKEINDLANDYTPPELPTKEINPMQQMLQSAFSTTQAVEEPEEIKDPKTISDYMARNNK